MSAPDIGKDLSAVPLFPLPNLVLFPRAVTMLHIFEERYKAMTADVLEGDRQIAMALLKPGWEKNYYQKPPLEPIVCVGTILSHERLPDGKYNFLLQGHTRARLVRELKSDDRLYRVAELEALPETNILEIDLSDHRQRLTTMFNEGGLSAMPAGRQFQQILASPMPTSDVADLVAFNFLEDIALKLSLLADTDVRRRVTRTIEGLEEMVAVLQPPEGGSLKDPSLN